MLVQTSHQGKRRTAARHPKKIETCELHVQKQREGGKHDGFFGCKIISDKSFAQHGGSGEVDGKTDVQKADAMVA